MVPEKLLEWSFVVETVVKGGSQAVLEHAQKETLTWNNHLNSTLLKQSHTLN
jgi:hypothetical protein